MITIVTPIIVMIVTFLQHSATMVIIVSIITPTMGQAVEALPKTVG